MDKNELEIFNKNEKLVPFTYNKYFTAHKNHKDDLLQEGFLSLINCIGKFNVDKGQFSTYAIKVIKNSMVHWLCKLSTKTARDVPIDLVLDQGFNSLRVDDEYERIDFNITMQSSINLFNDKQKNIIKNWLNGTKHNQIALQYDCSSQYIVQVIKKFRHIFKYKWGQDIATDCEDIKKHERGNSESEFGLAI